MSSGIVVLFGDLAVERQAFDLSAAEFGWTVKEVATARDLAQANVDHNLTSVLFDPETLSLAWDGALRVILEAAPRALPILCHRFAAAIDWPQVAEAGAFDSILLPLNQREGRQSLGFVWGSKRHSAAISIPPVAIPDAPLASTLKNSSFALKDWLPRSKDRPSTVGLGAHHEVRELRHATHYHLERGEGSTVSTRWAELI